MGSAIVDGILEGIGRLPIGLITMVLMWAAIVAAGVLSLWWLATRKYNVTVYALKGNARVVHNFQGRELKDKSGQVYLQFGKRKPIMPANDCIYVRKSILRPYQVTFYEDEARNLTPSRMAADGKLVYRPDEPAARMEFVNNTENDITLYHERKPWYIENATQIIGVAGFAIVGIMLFLIAGRLEHASQMIQQGMNAIASAMTVG